MMKKSDKRPLDLNLYEKYNIDQQYNAYVLTVKDINDQEAEDIEYQYVTQGYKIFYSELKRSHEDLFILTLIVAKILFTF